MKLPVVVVIGSVIKRRRAETKKASSDFTEEAGGKLLEIERLSQHLGDEEKEQLLKPVEEQIILTLGLIQGRFPEAKEHRAKFHATADAIIEKLKAESSTA